jgi:hypothetical protein
MPDESKSKNAPDGNRRSSGGRDHSGLSYSERCRRRHARPRQDLRREEGQNETNEERGIRDRSQQHCHDRIRRAVSPCQVTSAPAQRPAAERRAQRRLKFIEVPMRARSSRVLDAGIIVER